MGFVEDVRKSASQLDSLEGMLGKGLNIPYNPTNSGARKIMNGTHQSHTLVLTRGEVPYIMTGFENRFGEKSSSIVTTEAEYEVIAKISKFSYAPDHHYYLIVRNTSKPELDILERISYKHRTEMYGYLHNNTIMDSYANPGMIIPKGEVVRRSTGFDQYGNKTNGRNINVVYEALDDNMEDSVIISDYCSQVLSAPLIRKVSIIINENDIPLNLYGNDNLYKIFPDIGEDIKNGILMAYRREKREEAIYTQSVANLQQIMMSDDKVSLKGKVIDIDIMCNNPEHIRSRSYNQQFLAYYQDRLRMNNEIIAVVAPFIAQGYTLSYNLLKMFTLCKDEVDGKKFIDKKAFSNIIIEFAVMENRLLGIGDKVADRYGGKGVVSKILPQEQMPKLPNGQYVDMIKNSSTMYNRENAAQIFELELNYISMNILDLIRNTRMSAEDALNMIYRFLDIISSNEANYMRKYTARYDYNELIMFIESMLSRTCIYVSNLPVTECIDIDILDRLYNEFPWIEQCYLQVPIQGSNGNLRYVKTRRPVVAAPQYCIRLKQFAEEKFSVTSLSSTNIMNENAKSKASKNYKEPHSSTPIKFGQMESGDLNHMGSELVVMSLMLHSSSPHGRRLVEQVAVGDPYNVDVKLDTRAKSRAAEKLNARLKTMGYRLVFKKKRKIKRYAMLKPGLVFRDDPNTLVPGIIEHEEGYNYDHWYNTLDEIDKIKSQLGIHNPGILFYEDPKNIDDVINPPDEDDVDNTDTKEKG